MNFWSRTSSKTFHRYSEFHASREAIIRRLYIYIYIYIYLAPILLPCFVVYFHSWGLPPASSALLSTGPRGQQHILIFQ